MDGGRFHLYDRSEAIERWSMQHRVFIYDTYTETRDSVLAARRFILLSPFQCQSPRSSSQT